MTFIELKEAFKMELELHESDRASYKQVLIDVEIQKGREVPKLTEQQNIELFNIFSHYTTKNERINVDLIGFIA